MQTFTVTTTYVSFSGSASQNDIPSPGFQPIIYNTSGDTLLLRWKRVEQNIPGWWRSSVCTENFCYSIPDDSATWTLLPGDPDLMYIHIYPYGFADTGEVVVKLFNVNQPSDSVRITFHADIATGLEEHSVLASFGCDVVNHVVAFSTKGSGRWILADISGRIIASGISVPNHTISVSAGMSGVYMIIFRREDGVEEIRKVML